MPPAYFGVLSAFGVQLASIHPDAVIAARQVEALAVYNAMVAAALKRLTKHQQLKQHNKHKLSSPIATTSTFSSTLHRIEHQHNLFPAL
jgi:hypothetical protein